MQNYNMINEQLNKQKLEAEFKANNDASAVIELEAKLKQLTEYKKTLGKEIIELKYVSHSQGKQLERAEVDPEDPNEADNLIYKIKALKQKKEAMQTDAEKHQSVMQRLKHRIEEAKKKAENERKQVEQAERKHNEQLSRVKSDKNAYNTVGANESVDLDTQKDDYEYQKQFKILVDAKKESKTKRLELEKMLIELHERDKENRLLNLKVKELERIVPQNRLNPMSRDKSSGIVRRRRRMKNSSIHDANKSVLVTKKEQRLKQIRGRNKSPDLRISGKVNNLDKKKQSNDGKLSTIQKAGLNSSKQSLDNIGEEPDNTQHIKEPKQEVEFKEPIYSQKQASEKEPVIGKGLNGEPTFTKPPKQDLEKVNPPMKLNPDTFKTEVDIKQK